MTTDILSLLLGAGTAEVNQQLLVKIFDINPLGLHLLVPVRDQQEHINAFRFINLNHGRSFMVSASDESSLLTDGPATNTAFKLLLEVYETGKQVDTVHELSVNGETRWFDVRFRKLADGVLFLYEEITRYKNDAPDTSLVNISREEIKKKLKETESLLQSVLDTVTVNVYVFKAVFDKDNAIIDFTYVFVNKEAVQAETTNPLGKSVLELHPFVKTEGLFKQYCEVMRTGEPKDFEMKFDNAAAALWYRITARKMDDKLVVTAENITVRKRVEEELQQSIEGQKHAYRNMAAVNDELETARRELAILHAELKAFNSVAANDYKETLRRLYTSMEYIVTHDAQRMSHEGRANVRRAQGAIQRMKLLTEDILAYSGINALETEKSVVDLYALTIEVKKELLKKMDEEHIEVDCKNMPEIEGYPMLISLLFHHLLDHAIKSKKKDSPLTIHISCDERYGRDILHPQANASMKYSVVEIKDNGMGFEPQQAESLFNIFDRSYESSRKGSGIGLAIAKKIMDMHGGFIYAVGDPGNGAAFYCCFPSIS